MLKFTIDSNESVFVPDDGDSDNGDQDPNQIPDLELDQEDNADGPSVTKRRSSGGYKKWAELQEKQKKRVTEPFLEMLEFCHRKTFLV